MKAISSVKSIRVKVCISSSYQMLKRLQGYIVVRKIFDLSVYFVADPALCERASLFDTVKMALDGGVTLLQLRNKVDALSDVLAQAKVLMGIANSYNVPLLINDHVGIAREINADGVHLGQGDVSASEAREMLGPDKIVGQTAFSAEHMAAIDPNVVDYVGTGPFFVTQTDKGKPVLGGKRFTELVGLSPVPVVGIGGITPDNACQVIKAGANGVAMMRSISADNDPRQAADIFVQAVRTARLEDVA